MSAARSASMYTGPWGWQLGMNGLQYNQRLKGLDRVVITHEDRKINNSQTSGTLHGEIGVDDTVKGVFGGHRGGG